jgi:hypothetical protein
MQRTLPARAHLGNMRARDRGIVGEHYLVSLHVYRLARIGEGAKKRRVWGSLNARVAMPFSLSLSLCSLCIPDSVNTRRASFASQVQIIFSSILAQLLIVSRIASWKTGPKERNAGQTGQARASPFLVISLHEQLGNLFAKQNNNNDRSRDRACAQLSLRGRSARSSSGKRVPMASTHIYNRGVFRVK